MRAFGNPIGNPVHASDGGQGLRIGDLGYFDRNPGPGFVPVNGQILREADYPSLSKKLRRLPKSDQLGVAPVSQGDDNGVRYPYNVARLGTVVVVAYATYVFALSRDGGASFSYVYTQSAIIAGYPISDTQMLAVVSGNSFDLNNPRIELITLEGGGSQPVLYESNGNGLHYGYARNLRSGNHLVAYAGRIYRGETLNALAPVASLTQATGLAVDESGLAVAASRVNVVLVSTDDFATSQRISMPVPEGKNGILNFVYQIDGTWFVTAAGAVYRTRTPLVANSWRCVYAAPQSEFNIDIGLGAFGGGVGFLAHRNSGSAQYLQTVDDGQTFQRIAHPITVDAFINAGSSFLRFQGAKEAVRFNAFPGLQTPNLQSFRSDGRVAYMRAR